MPVPSPQDWTELGLEPVRPSHKQSGLCPPGTSGPNCCYWDGQNNDGILDVFAGLARFGLMTLDALPNPNTGTVAPTNVDPLSALAGNWSYFHNWKAWANPSPLPAAGVLGYATPPATRSGPAAGEPAGCSTGSYLESGARNPAAPPWEGPLTPFGPWCTDSFVAQTNQSIQNELLAMRPFGASPLSALVDDAQEFLFNDQDKIASSAYDFGAYSDQFWIGGCRQTFIILLTDGEPNLDMRGPPARASAAVAPTASAENVLYNLRTDPAATRTRA